MRSENTPEKEPRISLQTLRVLNLFMVDMHAEHAGADLMRLARISSGTLYPILYRFESAGWLQSRWEDIDPVAEARPRRRLYRLTGHGVTCTRAILTELQPFGATSIGAPAWTG